MKLHQLKPPAASLSESVPLQGIRGTRLADALAEAFAKITRSMQGN